MKQLIKEYSESGFVIIRNILNKEDIDEMINHYMELRFEGPKPGDKGGNPNDESDPLNKFPRFLDMHEWDSKSEKWVFNENYRNLVSAITESDVKLFRSMLYFKPPQAKGVAYHQDERYSETKNLTALWIALDKCTIENGCLSILPNSHNKGIIEITESDFSQYFTSESIIIKEESVIPVELAPGDAVIFDGLTPHGSKKNISSSFRRSFILHYERKS